MEEKKKHIEIHIKMDENEQIATSSKISNANAAEVTNCYLAGAVYVANIVADCSNGKHDAKQVLGEMFRRFAVVLAHFDEIMEKEEDNQ
ncbi:MAG: hypothetical protein ACLRYD_01140 [Ruminococcus callidus]